MRGESEGEWEGVLARVSYCVGEREEGNAMAEEYVGSVMGFVVMSGFCLSV